MSLSRRKRDARSLNVHMRSDILVSKLFLVGYGVTDGGGKISERKLQKLLRTARNVKGITSRKRGFTL